MSDIERLQLELRAAKLEVIALKQKHENRNRILSVVRDMISQLRLDMKYLMFDLEATRRERDHFKTLWSNK